MWKQSEYAHMKGTAARFDHFAKKKAQQSFLLSLPPCLYCAHPSYSLTRNEFAIIIKPFPRLFAIVSVCGECKWYQIYFNPFNVMQCGCDALKTNTKWCWWWGGGWWLPDWRLSPCESIQIGYQPGKKRKGKKFHENRHKSQRKIVERRRKTR